MTPRDEPPPGYQRANLEERLTGCGLIVGGLVGMGVAFLVWQFGALTLFTPPGLPAGFTPIASPLACMVPLMAVLSAGLALLGLRKLLTGE
ncbi:MAG: hypothetical protein IT306_14180 [Chloroflexi bacterium]|nr:hypothetical protein [Chloroflexota bacterium]